MPLPSTVPVPGKEGYFFCKECGREKEKSEFRSELKVKYGLKQPCIDCLVAKDSTKLSPEALQAEIARRVTLYRCDALGALRQIALMKVRPSDYRMMQVKYMAAKELANPPPSEGSAVGSLETLLAGLNERYRSAAPRISRVRQQTLIVELESGALPPIASESIPVLIEQAEVPTAEPSSQTAP
jgi:hypothetical protein